ncbi:hypothetical protein CLOM_g12538 [Closterium sp. NIES-68]|nr:hypothetical protein CLOM_g12538 [Closterium sp. NIES-68]
MPLVPLRVARPSLSCRRSSPVHLAPLAPSSQRPLRATAARTTAAALRQEFSPTPCSAAASRVRQPVACRSAAEAAGLASFPWENAVEGAGERGGEEEWGREAAAAAAGDVEVDVAIVGAGVVGLCIADALLASSPSTRVAVIDSSWPCAGATGAGGVVAWWHGGTVAWWHGGMVASWHRGIVAGQGYIWMGHRTPGSMTWQLAAHSKQRWEHMAGELEDDHRRLAGCTLGLGRMHTGSMLVPSHPSHAAPLLQHHHALQQAGLPAHLLSPAALADAEPALQLPAGAMSALLLPSDWQLDATLAVHALLARCRQHASSGRYVELFQESVSTFLWAPEGSRVVGVATAHRRVLATRAVVVATGSWSSGFMAHALNHSSPASSAAPQAAQHGSRPQESSPGSSAASGSSPGGGEQGAVVPHVRPRKGFLLQLVDPPPALALRHGLMEFDYTANYAPAPSSPPHHSPTPHSGGSSTAAPALPSAPPPAAISMTATCDHHGHLLIGSSREFAGFSVAPHAPTIAAILRRTAHFLPALTHLLLPHEGRGAWGEGRRGRRGGKLRTRRLLLG